MRHFVGITNNHNHNQRYECRVAFPGYEARVGFPVLPRCFKFEVSL